MPSLVSHQPDDDVLEITELVWSEVRHGDEHQQRDLGCNPSGMLSARVQGLSSPDVSFKMMRIEYEGVLKGCLEQISRDITPATLKVAKVIRRHHTPSDMTGPET